VDYGCIETKAGDPVSERLLFIYESIQKVIETYKPAKAAIENLYFGRNVTSAISVAEARGVLCVALAQANIPVLELRPNTVKKGVTGVISAGKAQVQEMVRIILGLRDTPRPDHAADALAMAICCAQSHELPV
jgi:crossover junction endodeoxyribonuclease RuvC